MAGLSIGDAWAAAGQWYRIREEEGWRGQVGRGIKLANERGEVSTWWYSRESRRRWRVSAWQEGAAAECQLGEESWAEEGSMLVVIVGVQ
jgi:hypothetical protein